MRAISPVIAIVILLLMTVAAGGMAYLTITTYQETAQTEAAGGIQQLGQQAGTILKVESVKEGTVYVRNIGTENVEGVKIYADGQEVGTCDEVAEGEYCIVQVEETIDCGDDQRCTLTIGASTTPTVTGETMVDEEEMQGEGCGNGVCSINEMSDSCSEDCGGSLSFEKNDTWLIGNGVGVGVMYVSNLDVDLDMEVVTGNLFSAGSATFQDARAFEVNSSQGFNDTSNYTWSESIPFVFAGIDVGDVDNDATDEIVTVGTEPATQSYAALHVFNLTNGVVNKEANTSWGSGYSKISVFDVSVADVDDDNIDEIVMGGAHSTGVNDIADLRVYNITNSQLVLQTNTSYQKIPGQTSSISSLHTKNLDGDSEYEIVTGGVYSDSDSYIYEDVNIFEINSTGDLDLMGNYSLNTTLSSYWIFSISIGDVDHDSVDEVLVFGRDGDNSLAYLEVSEISGYTITPQTNTSWSWGGISTASNFMRPRVIVHDIDSDSRNEVIIGYVDATASPFTLYVKVFEVNQTSIIAQTNTSWTPPDESAITSLWAGDIDQDGGQEILTGGSWNDGVTEYGEFRIYSVS